jgi:hypothetical protein
LVADFVKAFLVHGVVMIVVVIPRLPSSIMAVTTQVFLLNFILVFPSSRPACKLQQPAVTCLGQILASPLSHYPSKGV